MPKPSLTIAPLHDREALPDPHEFALKILESIRFIDQNPDAPLHEIPPHIRHLWAIGEDRIHALRSEDLLPAILPEDYDAFWSMILFAHIYLRYYRLEDFADMSNFWHTYYCYEELLHHFENFEHLPGEESICLCDISILAE